MCACVCDDVQENEEKKERLRKMKEVQDLRDIAECKQFKSNSNALKDRDRGDDKRLYVGLRLYEVRPPMMNVELLRTCVHRRSVQY